MEIARRFELGTILHRTPKEVGSNWMALAWELLFGAVASGALCLRSVLRLTQLKVGPMPTRIADDAVGDAGAGGAGVCVEA